MAYDNTLAKRVRDYLSRIKGIQVEEKKMFGGLAFMVNGKMCINVTKNMLMCRFDPDLRHEVAKKKGFLPFLMHGRDYKGYCHVSPIGFQEQADFEYWLNICLDYNDRAKSSKKKRK